MLRGASHRSVFYIWYNRVTLNLLWNRWRSRHHSCLHIDLEFRILDICLYKSIGKKHLVVFTVGLFDGLTGDVAFCLRELQNFLGKLPVFCAICAIEMIKLNTKILKVFNMFFIGIVDELFGSDPCF